MYKKTMIMLIAYLKSINTDLKTFDATIPFREPDNYSSIYIVAITPQSPHENFINQTQKDDDTKVFTYKQTENISVRVDFRGPQCYENMATFKSSFLQEVNQEFLKEAGFSFLGLGSENPITNLRDVKVKQGLSVTMKLNVSYLIEDESPIIKDVNIKVSNNLN
jgi:hypothetical protein